MWSVATHCTAQFWTAYRKLHAVWMSHLVYLTFLSIFFFYFKYLQYLMIFCVVYFCVAILNLVLKM